MKTYLAVLAVGLSSLSILSWAGMPGRLAAENALCLAIGLGAAIFAVRERRP